MKTYDVVVIGSGISSLTCATFLAMKGHEVLVLEQYKKPGGYLHSFKRFGHVYETGAHYVGALEPKEPFHTLLSYLGIYDPELFLPLDPDAFDVFNFPDSQFNFPKGYEAIIESLSSEFPEEAPGIGKYFAKVRETVRYFQTYHYSLELNLDKLMEGLDISLETVVKGYVRNPKLQAILFGHCYLHGVTPKEMAFGLHALVFDSLVCSPHGLKISGDQLAKVFVDRLKTLGAEVRMRAQVVRLHNVGKTITEVELSNGERIGAKTVISGAHPKSTLKWVEPTLFPPVFHRRMERVKESGGIFGVYAEAQGEIPLKRTRNYYYFLNNQPEDLLEINKADGTPRVVFVTRPDRNATHHEKFPVTLHAPGPYEWFQNWENTRGKRPEAYLQMKEALAEKVFDFVEERTPGIKQSIVRYETSTALTNLFFNGSLEGSGYGIYHSMENTGLRAIGPRTKVPNLLLTGQSTLVPGLLGAATSGLRTAGEVVGLKGLLEDLIQVRDQ